MLVSDSLTPCRLVNLIDVTLACEDANSKLVEVVTVADVDSEDHVGNSLLQIWELTFGPKTPPKFVYLIECPVSNISRSKVITWHYGGIYMSIHF